MDLYYIRISGNSQRALFVLAEIGAPYTPHLLDVRKGENKSPEYVAVNPMGKVPTLVDGGLKLWESNAIAWYLAEKFSEKKLLPKTPEGRADVLRWQFFNAIHVATAAGDYFYNTVGYKQRGGAPDAKRLEEAKKHLERFLPVLDGALCLVPALLASHHHHLHHQHIDQIEAAVPAPCLVDGL